jgi:hypothetical protein
MVYTTMRLLVFIAVWLLLQLLTPLRGLWALVLALLVSGAISFFLLNRQRDAMSGVVAGFFGRINDRIDASTRAEDYDDLPEGQTHPERKTGDQDQGPGGLQGGDQPGPPRT